MKLQTPFDKKLAECPRPGEGVHSWALGAANVAALTGVSREEAAKRIVEKMPRAETPHGEVDAALEKAFSENGGGGVSMYRNVKDNAGTVAPLVEILAAIRSGQWAELVSAVRNADTPDARAAAKARLPGFTAAGVFEKRKADKLKRHSGFLILDIDGLTDPHAAEATRDKLAEDAHTLASFVSPSGLGAKAVIAIDRPKNADEHKAAFLAVVDYWRKRGVEADTSGQDVSRLCFVSHDEHAVVKDASTPFEWRDAEPETGDDADPLAGAKSLAELADTPPDPEQTLLGNRFLCRRGAVLAVGRSGLGKSSASAQQDICWALGREAFGIAPARPLNILCIQAENDDGDLYEMARGVIVGMKLHEAEVAEVHQRTTYLQWFEVGQSFLAKLDRALQRARDDGRPFDLVRIDPLLSFAGGNLVDPGVIAEFCRTGLNSLAFRHNVGVLAVHHTPKINLTARPRMDGPEWIYAASGSADLSNWARGILVMADPVGQTPGVFRFIAAKRGKRLEWRDTNGELEFERYFAHAVEGGGMFWREATPEEIATASTASGAGQKMTRLGEIARKDAATMTAHAMNILKDGALSAGDFKKAVMLEFGINERDAREVGKWLTQGDDKPVKVLQLGKTAWHGTGPQLHELKNPPLKGVGV